jgi:hypothetical protein
LFTTTTIERDRFRENKGGLNLAELSSCLNVPDSPAFIGLALDYCDTDADPVFLPLSFSLCPNLYVPGSPSVLPLSSTIRLIQSKRQNIRPEINLLRHNLISLLAQQASRGVHPEKESGEKKEVEREDEDEENSGDSGDVECTCLCGLLLHPPLLVASIDDRVLFDGWD